VHYDPSGSFNVNNGTNRKHVWDMLLVLNSTLTHSAEQIPMRMSMRSCLFGGPLDMFFY